MTHAYGFTLQREEFISEYGITARIYRHDRTGAEVLSMIAPDENKVFGITFRTPPWDSTGVAHILEHSVLCGSRKYPVKEPFVELLKGSLQTFLNAFTYPDKTCYPIASQNLQDFYNLMDIYVDAVFHPLLERPTLDQEAWHYDLEDPAALPAYKGVVFNEMKGVYASADSLLAEHSQRVLFPETTYGHDYGGDPRRIPDLTWEQLVAFHRKYYHPSNARIYFYGDDDPDERLRRLQRYLEPFDHQPVDSTIALQSPATPLPERVTLPYPSGPEDEDARCHLTVNWRLDEGHDPEKTLGLYLLDHILTESPASPLRKALMDSGLGEDLAGTGLETQIRQLYFSTGLKGIAPDHADRVIELIMTTLRDLAANGIDPKTIDAAINSEEFHFRELNTGNYPRGLSLMITALQTWLYDGDPLAPIRFEAPLQAIRRRLASGERYFEELIRTCLLDNPHRCILLLQPDPGLKDRLDREENDRLTAVRAGWSHQDAETVIERTRALKRRQATPDQPEALRCIPSLTRRDLPRVNRAIPREVLQVAGCPVLFHDQPTPGITYLDLGFNLRGIPGRLLGLVPVWSRAVLETGTASEDYVELSQRIGRLTGGIDAEFYTSTHTESGEAVAWVFLRGKALDQRRHDLIRILDDVVSAPRLDHRERIRQIIAEEKADIESNIIPAGHRYVSLRLRAGLNTADRIQEELSGIRYLHTLRRLHKMIDSEWDTLRSELRELHGTLTSRKRLMINLTAPADTREHALRDMEPFLASRTDDTASPEDTLSEEMIVDPRITGFTIPAQVNYVGKAFKLPLHGKPLAGHALVASRYLRTAWLWDQVRVQGGAYGGFCAIDYRSGLFTMASYRDPNTTRTLEVYDATARYLKGLDLDADEIDRAVIGAIGDMDSYLFPDAKGYLSMCRWLAGDSEENRQRLRDEILSASMADFIAFGNMLDSFASEGRTAILGSRASLGAIPGLDIQALL